MKILSAPTLAVLGFASTAKAAIEWAGVFPIGDVNHQWSMQADDAGTYPDPAMKVVFFAVGEATQASIDSNKAVAETMITDNCTVIEAGETIGPITAAGSCYDLHVGSGNDSLYPMITGNISALAVFAQHFPIEFERDMHYFKDSADADIEPAFQEPDADHDHDHGHGSGPTKKCACAFKEKGLTIDCDNIEAINTALANLQTKGCRENCENEGCDENWMILQAHHDHCAALPIALVFGFHDFDHCPDGCSIVRQFVSGADQCPTVNCTDSSGNDAYARLLDNGCNIDDACPEATCKEDYLYLRMVHDACDHDALTQGSEEGLHVFEQICDFDCNLAMDVIEKSLKCSDDDTKDDHSGHDNGDHKDDHNDDHSGHDNGDHKDDHNDDHSGHDHGDHKDDHNDDHSGHDHDHNDHNDEKTPTDSPAKDSGVSNLAAGSVVVAMAVTISALI